MDYSLCFYQPLSLYHQSFYHPISNTSEYKIFFNHFNLLKRGVRISLRSKVNDSLITGIRIIDNILPIGRGQRQLIIGDRYTGKTSIYLSILLHCNYLSLLGTIEGFGTKRVFGIYIGINQNLSKLYKLITFLLLINYYSLIISSHSSSSSLFSYIIPLIGISIGERLRDRGLDTILCFDDLSKHSKSYRQISLILAKIPSRDAFPSDIFNCHSTILERCGKLKLCYFNGSITAFPIIETIASDITEYIATNIISITDGQLYTNKRLFLDSCRPAIDSGLSVSRIGSNAQCKLIKIISVGIKNELTNLRLIESSNSFNFYKLLTLNQIFFQDHLYISSINLSIILILFYRNGVYFNKIIDIQRLLLLYSSDYLYYYYLIFIIKSNYSTLLYIYILYLIINMISYFLSLSLN